MKTQDEQIEFANKLKELTDHYGRLLNTLGESTDKQSVLMEIQSILTQMNDLRNSYMKVSL